MVKFDSFNPKLYDSPKKGFSSDDEYILGDRVWENNELPIVDPFDMIHSMLKSKEWAWLLGYTGIAFDVPWNYKTDQEEFFDDEGGVIEAAPSKWVNGIRAKNYGPKPIYHYEKNKPYSEGDESEEENTPWMRT